MTREEAIKRMEICRNFLANNYSDMGEPNFTAFNMAIQALEQESILDNIKREIFNACSDNYHVPVYKLDCDEIFDIIDKYKAESKGKE